MDKIDRLEKQGQFVKAERLRQIKAQRGRKKKKEANGEDISAVILGILEQYEFMGAILATAIGAGIAYFVQTRTQNKIWRREYSIRIAEEVYGLLYGKLKRIICLF